MVGTDAVPVRPAIQGLVGAESLGPEDGVHLLHSMGDTFDVMKTLEERGPSSAVIVGASYVGLEMAEALRARGLHVTQVEQLAEVLPTVDPSIGAMVHEQLVGHGVDVRTSTVAEGIARAGSGLEIRAREASGAW